MTTSPMLFKVSLLDEVYLRVYENGYVGITTASTDLHRAKRDRIDNPTKVALELLNNSDPDAYRVRIEFINGEVRYYNNIPEIILPVYLEMANPSEDELRDLNDIPAIIADIGRGHVALHYNDLMEYSNPSLGVDTITDIDYLAIVGDASWTPRFSQEDVEEIVLDANRRYRS